MKLIMESWRSFIEENQVFLLPENLGPKFLDESIYTLLESERDQDPEAMTVEEIKNIPAEEIQKVYASMVGKEAVVDIQARSKKAKELDDKSSALSVAARNMTSGTLKFYWDKVKTVVNTVLKTDLDTGDKKAKEAEEASQKVFQIIKDAFPNPLEREIIRAVIMFTQESVPTVRDPEKFGGNLAASVYFANDGLRFFFKPTKETYQKAKIILNALIQTGVEESPELYRGLVVTAEKGKYPGLESYSVGKRFQAGDMVSFTREAFTAVNFATDERDFRQQPYEYPIVIKVPPGKLKRGADIDQFSRFKYQNEKETLVSGEFLITDIGIGKISEATLGLDAASAYGSDEGYTTFQQLFKKADWSWPNGPERFLRAYAEATKEVRDAEKKYGGWTYIPADEKRPLQDKLKKAENSIPKHIANPFDYYFIVVAEQV